MIVNEDQTSSAKSRVDGDYERYIRPLEDRLLRTLWRVVQDPLQGLLERVWSRIDTVRHHANPQAFVMWIGVNVA